VSWTRDQYVTQARALAEAEDSGRWTDTSVLGLFRVAMRREWRNLLNANNTYRWAERSVVTATDGVIALADLSSGSGDSREVLYRILGVAVNDKLYKEGRWRDYPLVVPTNNYAEELTYLLRAESLLLIPAETGITATVWVNHMPTPIDELAGGASAVEFPEGYEMLPCYEAAGLMLTKGGTETGSAADLLAVAAELRSDLLADLARRTVNPLTLQYGDSRGEWGG
jgi:hypothetical protein